MKTMLIASGGGHLNQLMVLRPRLGLRPGSTWVTYDTPHGSSALIGEPVVYAHHPTTRNLSNAIRNYRLACRVFAEQDVDRVISTGAAVAVPFMVRARQLGIPCHYIESATRTVGPSVTGRLLARVPGVLLYRQVGEWGGSQWRQGPCVFDGFMTEPGQEHAIRRVVVSFGTHEFVFSAGLKRLADVLGGLDIEVLWQLGSTPDPGSLRGRVVSRLPADELQTAIARADVVVGHAGVGLSLTALSAGKVPVLLPRRRRHREHTDDHQLQLAEELHRRGLAISAEAKDVTDVHLADAAGLDVRYEESPPFHLVD